MQLRSGKRARPESGDPDLNDELRALLDSLDVDGRLYLADFSEPCAELLRRGADPNVRSSQPPHHTALMIAAAIPDLELVACLAQAGADPRMRNRPGRGQPAGMPLDYMTWNCSQNDEPCMADGVRCLLPLTLEGHGRAPYCGGALCDAARCGDDDALRAFVALGLSLSSLCHGMTPLHLAAANGHRATIETLLELGADPSVMFVAPGRVESARDFALNHGEHPCTLPLDTAHADSNASVTLGRLCALRMQRLGWPWLARDR